MTLKMFKIFKKKEKEIKEEKAEDKSVGNVEIHSMPKKFRNVSGGQQNKKLGLLIVAGGFVVLAAAASALAWYVYQSGGTKTSPRQPAANTAPAAEIKKEAEEPSAAGTGEAKEENPEDLAEKDCGISLSYLSDEFSEENKTSYESDGVLRCLGESIIDDCKKAVAAVKTNNAGGLSFRILGKRNNDCLTQITYPDIASITAEEFKIYADKYINCFYDLTELESLGYGAGQLADYVYRQSGLVNLSGDSQCSGTAVELWRDELARSQTPEEELPKLKLGIDSDGDGLTDVEENTVFVTNVNKKDTDGDSYEDKQEIFNFYNPAGDGKLTDSGLVVSYANSNYGYSVLYPKDWQIEDRLGGDSVFFQSGIDGSTQVLVQDNIDKKGIKAWYADLTGNPIESVAQKVEIIAGEFEVIYSIDGLTAYLTAVGGGTRVFVITYSPEESGVIEFAAVFNMMVKSFKLE